MRQYLGNLYAALLGWPALSKLHTGLFYLSARALGLQNYSSDRLSGEGRLARTLLRDAIRPVVFDVGANHGDWLATIRAISSDVRVHAFEPQSALARSILAKHPDVVVNNVAVGENTGILELFDYADHPGSQHASLVHGVIGEVHRARTRSTTVPVTTIDSYCAERRITRIDLLKIDVEGFELQVLKGAKQLLGSGGIRAIQFEHTHINLLQRVFVDDFFKLLDDNFSLYRLLPHGVLPLRRGNHWLNEQFCFQNLFALDRRSTADAAASSPPASGVPEA